MYVVKEMITVLYAEILQMTNNSILSTLANSDITITARLVEMRANLGYLKKKGGGGGGRAASSIRRSTGRQCGPPQHKTKFKAST